MSKKTSALLSIIILCFLLVSCMFSQKKINPSGKLLMRDPNAGANNGLVLLDLHSLNITPTGSLGYDACFMDSDSKFLKGGFGSISLFDTQTCEETTIYQSAHDVEFAYANKSYFSVIEKNELFLVDISNGSKELLAGDADNSAHSWNKKGTIVYYTNKDKKICKLDVETRSKEVLFDGVNPQVSDNGQFVAYIPSWSDNEIIIKDLINNKTWRYHAPIFHFCISPDGEYLAVVEYWRGIGFYSGYKLKIVDYKTNKTQTVLEKYAPGNCFGIDWTE